MEQHTCMTLLYVDRRSSKEYAHPAKFLGDEELVAKSRASTELDNLLTVAKNWRNKSDGQYGHTHEKATGGFDYGDVLFRVGNKYFTGLVNVEVTDRGRRLKDITKIKETTAPTGRIISTRGSKAHVSAMVTDTTVPQNGDGVNTQSMQNSEKDAPVY